MSISNESLRNIVEEKLFYPVFQPIVKLDGGKIVGYEALTRFTGEHTPNEVFDFAQTSDLLAPLELATMDMALTWSPILDQGGLFLAINLSPDVLVHHTEKIDQSFAVSSDKIVVEINERCQIADYQPVRAASDSLGRDTKLAIDDLGSEYAHLRKIVELHPSYIKLDIGLIRGIDQDPYRAALIKHLQHFGDEVGCLFIAEGVETEGERQALQQLGITLAQGFLLGRPQRFASFAAMKQHYNN